MHLGFSLFSEDVTFGEFTMQVYHVSATGSFVQVIYILCDDGDIVPLFQFGQKMMSLIGYGMQQLFSTLIIEVQYDFWIFIKGSGKLLEYSEIVQIYQYIHKTNFIEDERALKYRDSKGKERRLCRLELGDKSKDEMLQMIDIICRKNPTVKIGYR